MEQQVFYDSPGGIRIEGRYADSGGATGAVIAHPHPLMGGDMGNPVVQAVAETLSEGGISTLRFNFRGVGRSSGRYESGVGEQEDLLAAVSFLEKEDKRRIILIGYSFGAWIVAGVLTRKCLPPAILISPPIALLGFDFEPLRGSIGLIICGSRDSYCPSERIGQIAAGLSCPLVSLDADHFFMGQAGELAWHVSVFIKRNGV
jgi:alpha/beta superfamily hydrolase